MTVWKGIFSDSYNEYQARRDQIRSLALEAKDFLKGGKLFGNEINMTNPEELIAFLYVLYKDKELYHEPLR